MTTTREIFSQSIADQVYAFLEEDIVNQKYPAGARIDLEEIETSFGISRIPIRDALERLIEKGLVRKVPRVGYFTVKPSIDELKDLYRVRRLLEEFAISQDLRNADRGLAEDLRDRFRSFVGKASFTTDEKRELLQLDLVLHKDVVIGLSDSPLLEGIYDGIKAKINLSTHLMYRLEHDIQEHLGILEAILSHDQNGALECLREHLAATEETTLRFAAEGAV